MTPNYVNILKIQINAIKYGDLLVFFDYNDLFKALILKYTGLAHTTTTKGKWVVNKELYRKLLPST